MTHGLTRPAPKFGLDNRSHHPDKSSAGAPVLVRRREPSASGEIAPQRETDDRTRFDTRKTILYIHHSRGLGGALVSLVSLVQRLDQSKYRPVVACLYNSEVVPYLRKHGIEVQVCEGLSVFQHSTAGWFRLYNPLGVWYVARELLSFLPSAWRTKRLVHEQRADLVHLKFTDIGALGAGHMARRVAVDMAHQRIGDWRSSGPASPNLELDGAQARR